MTKVRFYENVQDELLKFAVIITKTNGKWVFCKHKQRETFEIPGGHREEGETIQETAQRELYEETGAISYNIEPICVYSVNDTITSTESFGMLYYANVTKFESEIHSEIEKIIVTDKLIENWTYPDIQPYLIKKYLKRIKKEGESKNG